MAHIHIVHRRCMWRGFNMKTRLWCTKWYKDRETCIAIIKVIYPYWFDGLYDISIHITFLKVPNPDTEAFGTF